jgi:uroporphyrinogen-III synthase
MIADFDYETQSTLSADKRRPLAGKRVVITRAEHQSEEVEALLRERGAEPLLYPCIAIAPPEDTSLLDAAIVAAARGEFDWLVLTSANTVTSLAERIAALGLPEAIFANMKVAAVGTVTTEEAQCKLGLAVAILPEQFRAEALARAIDPAPGTRIFLPQADAATSELQDELIARGAKVRSVIAYRTVVGEGGADIPGMLAQRAIDAITFASPSAVCNFIWRLVEEGGSTKDLAGVTLACIGPATEKKARECGLNPTVIPPVYTLENLIQSLEECFRNPQPLTPSPVTDEGGR